MRNGSYHIPKIEFLIPVEWLAASFLDPSGKSSEANDYKAVVTVGKNRETGLLDVLHAFIRKATVNEMWEAVWSVHREFGCPVGRRDEHVRGLS